MEEEPLMTVPEIAKLLRTSKMNIYRLIRRGELPAIRIGHKLRVRRSDLKSYLESCTANPAAPPTLPI